MAHQRIYYPPGSGIPAYGVVSQGVSGGVTPTLQTLTLSDNNFSVGDPQGTLVGLLVNTTAWSTITFNSLSVANSLQLTNVSGMWKIEVGSAAPGSPSTLTFDLIETLAGAFNTPKTTSGFSVNEMSFGGAPVIQLVLDMAQSFPFAA